MISICIVNWNTKELLQEGLQAIAQFPPAGEYEIILVDNASADGSAEMTAREFPQVRLLANRENHYYAKANNQALAEAKGDLLLLLNPDVRVEPECLTRLAEFLLTHPLAGGVAPRLFFPDGRSQASCRAFPTPGALLPEMLGLSRIFPNCKLCGAYRLAGFDFEREQEVDQPMASAFMLKRQALEEIGGFDENFPMFFNDVDLCLRLRQAGWKVFYLPMAKAAHHHGAATAQRKREMIVQSHDSLARFYRKHYRGRVSWLGYWSVIMLSRLAKRLRLWSLGSKSLESSVKKINPNDSRPFDCAQGRPANHDSKTPNKRLIVAIDGPAAAGKSTLAKILAHRLGYFHLDTGAMYRAVGWKANQLGVLLNDEAAVTEIARNIKITFEPGHNGEHRIIADATDISEAIRSETAGEWASLVSAIPGVRKALVELQRKLGEEGGVVAEGRDMQTVVFPRAEVKIFLTASVEQRAKRRYLELKAKGESPDLAELTQEMAQRDHRDSTRADSPLCPAPEAIIVDTDRKNIDRVVAEVLAITRQVVELRA
jgi:CMP/dCMP kinase